MRNRKLHDELERLVGWMISQGMPREQAEEMMFKSLNELRRNMAEGWKKIEKAYLENNKPITKS
jgi:hypothetical protein